MKDGLVSRIWVYFLVSMVAAGCDVPPDEAPAPDEPEGPGALVETLSSALVEESPDEVVAVGHGVAIRANGSTFVPTKSEAVALQRVTLKRLEALAGPAAKSRVAKMKTERQRQRAQQPSTSAVDAEIVDNADMISYLLEETHPSNALSLRHINGYLRHRADKIGSEPAAEQDGLEIQTQALTTTASVGGQAYLDKCFAAGVPKPPAWGSSDWVERKTPVDANGRNWLTPNFLGGGPAKVYTYTSNSPRGLCIALPRYTDSTTTKIQALGIICQGNDTSKSCFWDNKTGLRVDAKPNPPIPIVSSTFVGGFDLHANLQGICSDCHAGENSFVIHPGSLLDIGSGVWAKSYVKPLVHPAWSQDKRPGYDLELVSLSSGQSSCLTCHSQSKRGQATFGGRLPRVRDLTQGYCPSVFKRAMNLTMPPGAPNSAAYSAHRNALDAICGKPHTRPTKFSTTVTVGHGFFAPAPEVPMLGDFNGDGRTDIITFTMGQNADAWVALSNATGFGSSSKWHDWFGLNGEQLAVGDFNGDGRDDIVTFLVQSSGHGLVALSNGSSFGRSADWGGHTVSGEALVTGDFNGDGLDDVATLTKGGTNDALVNLSTGASFGPSLKWQDYISPGTEVAMAGDVDGDGLDDIVSFTRGTLADVWVSISTGKSFSNRRKWHDAFAFGSEIPRVADLNGDGLDDIITFTRGNTGDVFVALSNGSGFSGTGLKWHDWFAINNEIPFVGDVGADGFADLILFRQSPADVLVSKATP